MRGVITTSGSGWSTVGRGFSATVTLRALRTFRGGRGSSRTIEVASSVASVSVSRDGNDLTVRFDTTIPLIDTSEGRLSWNVQLETDRPEHQATFLIDVA
jgi:hypothetical protein